MNTDFCTHDHLHLFGDSATHPIDPRCGALAALLLVAGEGPLPEDLENRVLPFESEAAGRAAALAAQRQKAGRPVDIRDTQIAR